MLGKLSILFAFCYLYSIGIVKTGNTKVPSEDNMCAPPDQYTSLVQSLQACANALKHCHQSQCIQPCPLPSSCKEIKENWPDSPSGYYHIGGTKPSYIYCNMEELCGSDEGWTRVAYLDMSDPSEVCPTGFRLYESNGVRACGRPHSSVGSCQSVQFPSNGISYSQVCGRVVGYQYDSPDAIYKEGANHDNIDSYYVDGISLTRGSPRQHIWTFMASRHDNIFENNNNLCPCSVGSTQFSNIQSFVGNDYFCESGCPGNIEDNTVYFSDPLWDGKQCGSLEQECCKAPGLPWFHKVLNSTTTDYIELRVCADQYTNNEDVPVANFEIYVM